jgi:transaldolase
VATARLTYQRYEQMLAGERWQALAAAGARPQRPLWASTSTKDPAYPDTRYVVDLVAPDVVNTMPEATLRAVADHAVVPADSIHGTYAQAQDKFSRLAAIGVDYDDVVTHLEEEGISKFDAAWRDLADELQTALDHHSGSVLG